MKKFLKTIAIMLAFVMVIDVPVSAANVAAVNNGSAAVVAAEADGNDVSNTNDGNDGTTDGTGDGNDTNDGTDDGVDTTPAAQVVAVAVKGSKTYNVEAGDTGVIVVNVVTNKELKYDVNWTVKGDAVTIKGEGNKCTFTAVKGGKATITATAGNKSDSVVVNVKEYITAMNFAAEEYTSYVKHKVDFSEELVKTPVNGNDTITYSVSNTKFATVDKNGVVTMKKATAEGVVLTAATERGIFAQTTIKIEAGNPVKKIKITNGKKLTLENVDATALLKTEITSKNDGATTDTLTWTSSKPAIVEVEDNGDGTATVTAVGVGSSKITVKASSGKKATITVTAKAPLTSLEVVDAVTGANSAEVAPKKKVTLELIRDPEVNNDKIKWTSSDSKIASVSSKGVVTAKKAGTVTITAASKAKGVDVKGTFEVTVVNTEITALGAVEGAATLWVGEETFYDANVEGGSSSDITWSSSNAKVLSIDEDGYAIAKKAGKVTLKATVTLADGKTKTNKMKVTVKQPATSISMKKAVVTVVAGKKVSTSFKVVQDPKGAKEKVAFEILSDTTGKASVNAKGKVTVDKNVTKAGDVIVVQASVGDITCEGEIRIIEGKNQVDFAPEGDGISVKKNTVTAEQGAKFSMGTTLKYEVNEDVTYSVNKSGIVSVAADGTVYALHPGTAKITAKTTSGAKKVLTVKVTAKKVEDNGTTDGNDGSGDGNDATTTDGNDGSGDGNDTK